ncbi:hypothetical protein SAMN05421874_12854 [Nonomuraea maritima]|uniref:Uncharacterized protein n=1 Tax=Nonomuraea maritima TaxID=683260 RepID=A0A1G9MID8_9ACTN|nr:hypothetical protein [Nonomuraea maritima]SDL74040.1 hypothetical protein SAMN05421874_12854 [Nonomuraea maritima]
MSELSVRAGRYVAVVKILWEEDHDVEPFMLDVTGADDLRRQALDYAADLGWKLISIELDATWQVIVTVERR